MALVEHLGELRRRLIICSIALVLGAIVAFALYDKILVFLIGPYEEITGKNTLAIIDPLEGFATRLKIAAWCGAFLASPVVLWELWRFVTPGLHRKEKKYAIPFIAASIILFALGALVALLSFEQALRFLIGIGGENLETFFTPAKYLGLVTTMVIAFGLAFEFPVLLVFLQLAGVLTSQRLRSWRRGAAVGILLAAALLTPGGDPYSLFAMALPMYLFYEGAIVTGRLMKK